MSAIPDAVFDVMLDGMAGGVFDGLLAVLLDGPPEALLDALLDAMPEVLPNAPAEALLACANAPGGAASAIDSNAARNRFGRIEEPV
ncbi:hypothetical protein [Paraburkholderia sp. Ac-20336]|uniref:hypothetical protein n=1 Tax=Paraburkholderia sp. Ac-20336 TaxID=2703886 RepID=UPI003217ACE8